MNRGNNLLALPTGAILLSVFLWQGCASAPRGNDGSNVYCMRDFYPLPFDKVLHYVHYLPPENMSATLCDRWGKDHDGNPYDGDFTFTIHRIFYPKNGDWRDYWCPRVDDVKKWEGDKLYYTDTYWFYSPSHHTSLSPAHIWADEFMTVGRAVPGQILSHTARHMTHDNCTNHEDGSVIHHHPHTQAFRCLALETTDWSPYTGGITNPVPVVRLDLTTYMRDTEDAPFNDFFKEQWYFARLENRYIPIHSVGYHQRPDKTRTGQWNMRLKSITNRHD